MLSSTACDLYWISRTPLSLLPFNCIFISEKRKSHKGFGWGSRADGGTLPFCLHLEIVDQTDHMCWHGFLIQNLILSAPLVWTFSWHPPSNVLGTICENVDPQFGLEKWTLCEEICGLLGNYTVSCGNYLPTFRDNVSVPSSRGQLSFPLGNLTREDGTDTLCRNVGK
jgi:hypothetical protein